MEISKSSDRTPFGTAPIVGESNLDYRARVAAHQAEIVERRHQELMEQTSSANSPAARIKIWERLHQAALPRAPTHKVLQVIAAHTGLSIEEVRDEQRQRTVLPIKPEA
jgi:predicted nuclease of restriction endonuclease-like RecB superfamily